MNFTVNQLGDIDIIRITDPSGNEKNKLIFSDSAKQFEENLTIRLNGRYELLLLFKCNTQLWSNKDLVMKRYRNMFTKSVNGNHMKPHVKFFGSGKDLKSLKRYQMRK